MELLGHMVDLFLVSRGIFTLFSVAAAPVRMAVTTKSTNNMHRRERGVKGTPVHCWQECGVEPPLWKRVWRFQLFSWELTRPLYLETLICQALGMGKNNSKVPS